MPRLFKVNHDGDAFLFECNKMKCRQILEGLYIPQKNSRVILIPKWVPELFHKPILNIYRYYKIRKP